MSKFIRAGLATFAMTIALAYAGAACASSGGPHTSRASNDRMDTTEFRRPQFRTIYDAIRALHPDWLMARGGPTSFRNTARQTPLVGVFIDGESRGYTLDKLTEFVGNDVLMVRRISGSESLATYGSDWPWGGIVITRAR